ncbi:hypothetical protein VQ042_13175 [Aurantimonas sp. A2-1-M11]|uniref:DUF6969 family protein n=1 Tax=Aurantimonas sp. A2-1-M11 TaxID=3113712 RepID=UPI002F939ECD
MSDRAVLILESPPPLDDLDTAELRRMAAAADEIDECLRVLGKARLNVVGEILKGAGQFVQMTHYPQGDVYDAETHSQYYYHAHREAEHGHFHCFLRAGGMPGGVTPVADPVAQGWPAGDKAIAHLVAISMDRFGAPIRLFTTNRWVTAETWYPAADVTRMIERFSVDHAFPSWPTNRWLTAMTRLFRLEIEALVAARDRVFAEHAARHPDRNPWEDRELETLSEIAIDPAAQKARVLAALAAR